MNDVLFGARKSEINRGVSTGTLLVLEKSSLVTDMVNVTFIALLEKGSLVTDMVNVTFIALLMTHHR